MKKGMMLMGAAVLAGGFMVSTASAHPLWMLPSEFNLSTEESFWITVDATASHGVFSFDKPIGLDNVSIYGPENDRRRIGPYYKGQRRSVFDLEIAEQGTYKVELKTPVRYMTSYVVGERDTRRRMMATKIEAASQIPDDAREVTTTMAQNISVFYVTQGAPSTAVLEPTGEGFELHALTHPSDVVVGEAAQFRFTYNGEPISEMDVEVVPFGTPYRDSRLQTDLVSDADGTVSYTPALAGPHLLSANLRLAQESVLADQVGVNFLLSFEALSQ
ncbi:DUF4198 domain-containing protein [Nitrincola alkalilacustris]|uniref:DUF4198 domain-containing protein n=1 Tax=Nitrincola alkalilacustris TaxID=1571224 RepID=UPI00124E07C4|nr:DUF4198 domain-containing protein [Nitrincola alkalilacustris]